MEAIAFRFSPQMKYVGSALFYATTSIIITFTNKLVLYTYKYPYPNIILLAQILFSMFALWFMKFYKIISYADFSWAMVRKVFWMSFWFMGYIVTGLVGLKSTNIPMYTTLRRLTVIPVLLSEYIILHKTSSDKKQQSVVVMVIGSLIAGGTDVSFNFEGYFYVLLNCITTALYLVYQKKISNEGLNTFGLLFYNNLVSIPFIIVICILSGEFENSAGYGFYTSFGFQLSFFLCAVIAFLLNYSIFLCNQINSPLTTSIIGQLKNVVVTLGGLFVFDDVIWTFWNIVGLLISLAGSIWYALIEYEEKKAQGQQRV